jgi:hypothetical protein
LWRRPRPKLGCGAKEIIRKKNINTTAENFKVLITFAGHMSNQIF